MSLSYHGQLGRLSGRSDSWAEKAGVKLRGRLFQEQRTAHGSHYSHHNLIRQVLWLSPSHRWRNWGSKRDEVTAPLGQCWSQGISLICLDQGSFSSLLNWIFLLVGLFLLRVMWVKWNINWGACNTRSWNHGLQTMQACLCQGWLAVWEWQLFSDTAPVLTSE